MIIGKAKVVEICQKSITEKTIAPIWMMRQAGRYLPEYHIASKKAASFLELCYIPDIVTEITMQPIHRFDFDAAIIFSDIMVLPQALGCDIKFIRGVGPVTVAIKSVNEFTTDCFLERLSPVFTAIKQTRQILDQRKALIGFAGAPWTIASYIVDGQNTKTFNETKRLFYQEREEFSKILDTLTEATADYLIKQIESGVDVVQVFESHAGVLSCQEFTELCIAPMIRIVAKIRAVYPDFPIIGFPKGAGVLYSEYAKQTNISATGIDYLTPMSWARDNIPTVLQGNLNPFTLAYNIDEALKQARQIKEIMYDRNFIFNLGHGVIPETPVEHVYRLVEEIRS